MRESPVLIRIESTDGIFDADGNEIGGLKIAAGDPVKIGTFLGRDLYRRVITTSSTGTVLSGFNPYDIVDVYGYVRFSNGVRYRIPFYYDSSHYSRVYVDDSNRVLFTTNGGTVSRAVIVIEYTNQ